MESAKCDAELTKIIKYSKICGENEENLAFFTVILMATLGTKNVHSAVGYKLKNSAINNFTSYSQMFINMDTC